MELTYLTNINLVKNWSLESGVNINAKGYFPNWILHFLRFEVHFLLEKILTVRYQQKTFVWFLGPKRMRMKENKSLTAMPPAEVFSLNPLFFELPTKTFSFFIWLVRVENWLISLKVFFS